MIQHAKAVLSELLGGLLRFGLDRLGDPTAESPDDAPGGLTVEACHPYGLRSRTRDPDATPDGTPGKGAGLLVFEFGGGDEGGMPTQDPRLTTLPDEGKGGTQLYGWTGSAVSYVLIDGASGNITIKPAAGASVTIDGPTAVGGAGGAAIARAPELQTWAAQVTASISALVAAAASGALASPVTIPPTVALAGSVAATKGTVV